MKENIDKLDYVKVKKTNTISKLKRQHKLWKQANILNSEFYKRPVSVLHKEFL